MTCTPGWLQIVGPVSCPIIVDTALLDYRLRECANNMGPVTRCPPCEMLLLDEDGTPRMFDCDTAPWINLGDSPAVQAAARRVWGFTIDRWTDILGDYTTGGSATTPQQVRTGKRIVELEITALYQGDDAGRWASEWLHRQLVCAQCSGLTLRTFRGCCDPARYADDPEGACRDWWDIRDATVAIEQLETDCCTYTKFGLRIETAGCETAACATSRCVIAGPWIDKCSTENNPNCTVGPDCPCAPVEDPCPSCGPETESIIPTGPRLGCYCEPFVRCRTVCRLAGGDSGAHYTPFVTVRGGAGPSTNIRVWLFEDTGSAGPDTNWQQFLCSNPISVIDLDRVDAGSVLRVDGASRKGVTTRGTVRCAATLTSRGGPFFVRPVPCHRDVWAVVEYDPEQTDAGLTVEAELRRTECYR